VAEPLSALLTREHRAIDAGIEAFMSGLDAGTARPESLHAALQTLRRHIYLEETLLFPPIRAGGMAMPVFVMLREHGALWRTMDELTDLIAADADPDVIRKTCRNLLEQLDQHNGKEEPVIYTHADAELPEPLEAEVAQFLADGQMPPGWVCGHAVA
jgi:hemerythrin-like domain-containing protein